jgi:glycosyltransferase involved in cell wall biosynthesis
VAAPLVSVVLTAYNRAGFIGKTIESLLTQTLGDFELLICDDVSTDCTAEVARKYECLDHRVTCHVNHRNLGMPGNLNEGIRRARGSLVANLHDGDYYEPTLLERWTSALQRNPNAAFVFNQYRIVDANGIIKAFRSENLPDVFPGRYLLEEVFFRRWRFDSPVWGTVMGRKAAYLEAGLFAPRFGCVADVDMWMRLAEKYDVAYVSEPLISLVDRDVLPSNWNIPYGLVHQIYREARMRHFEGRWFRSLWETARHAGFCAESSAYRAACLIKWKMSNALSAA